MKQIILLIATALTALPIWAAHAEGGCPPGQIPYTATPAAGSAASMASCGPIPNQRSSIQWESRWGAIASDPHTGIVGAVDRRKSKRDATKDAVSECKSRGGDQCKVEFTYRDQCVVTIAGDTWANNGYGESIEVATQFGMNACEKRGDTNCHIYYQACSLPVRVR